jgi:hypothetical protein
MAIVVVRLRVEVKVSAGEVEEWRGCQSGVYVLGGGGKKHHPTANVRGGCRQRSNMRSDERIAR